MLPTPRVTVWLWRAFDHLPPCHTAASLSPSEQIRLAAISAPRRRREYIAGHHLLRHALDYHSPQWRASHRLEHLPNCPPTLCGSQPSSLSFSLSHSGDSLCCAVTEHCQLGLDIEAPSRTRNIEKIAQSFFSAAEAEQIATLPPLERVAFFYRLWTLKESLAKACGSGLDSAILATEFIQTTVSTPSPWYSYSFALEQQFAAVTLSQPLHTPLILQQYTPEPNPLAQLQPPTLLYSPAL